MNATNEQIKAINQSGKVIVSASAGSGKTFVMIQKLVKAIEDGADLDSVLAVTFTKKAAAQMKEKLKKALISGIAEADGKKRQALKVQLSKVSSADISTIHSFCAKLLRTYFYALDIDGTFDIMASDDAQGQEFRQRAVDKLFENYYETDDENFKTLLAFYRRKRGDAYLKNLILSSYEELRVYSNYEEILNIGGTLFTDAGFESVVTAVKSEADRKYASLLDAVKSFAEAFCHPNKTYKIILGEMISAIEKSMSSDLFSVPPSLSVTRKPTDKTEEEKELGALFKAFRDEINSQFKAVRADICDRETEKDRFLKSGIGARAFTAVIKDFEREYAQIKRDENKLDYGDLEHFCLKLFQNRAIAEEIKSKYSFVFVDEYQDVNAVQEEIIRSVGGDSVFLVGDKKQAIYGFRGSCSDYFDKKFAELEKSSGALLLPHNFRSAENIIKFVNKTFSTVMTGERCGVDYAVKEAMIYGGRYADFKGEAKIHIFGKDDKEEEELKLYSIAEANREVRRSREALAVLKIVKEELSKTHYDPDRGEYVRTGQGDICILTRKRNAAADDIARALIDEGYSVAGAQEADILFRPEVKKMRDILSYIDNKQQDIPLATALLSPIGGLDCDELAQIRLKGEALVPQAIKDLGRVPFRECCRYYLKSGDALCAKLKNFKTKIEELRSLAEVLTASELIDRISEDTCLEAEYSKDGGERLKNIRRFADEGENMSLAQFLAKLKGGCRISAPSASASDSIKIMTMHASKGLEFPVVIISDICATYRGRDSAELPLSSEFGFAPRCFDTEAMLAYDTLLRRYVKHLKDRDEYKNELNLFYVACTRAMCRLHILAEEIPEYSAVSASEAKCYAKLFPFGNDCEEIAVEQNGQKRAEIGSRAEFDGSLYERIKCSFGRGYDPSNCVKGLIDEVNLPVKSSATAILKMSEEDREKAVQLFSGEGETSAEKGIAYHRFLELYEDFSVRDREGVQRQKDSFLKKGLITETQYALLDTDTLTEIVNIPIFSTLGKAELFREQEFLCMLPANEILNTRSRDGVLVQGAIDLLAKTGDGYKVIDYKYSHKNDEEIIATYSEQLALYKKAVSLITHTPPDRIETVIVNIFRKSQINL